MEALKWRLTILMPSDSVQLQDKPYGPRNWDDTVIWDTSPGSFKRTSHMLLQTRIFCSRWCHYVVDDQWINSDVVFYDSSLSCVRQWIRYQYHLNWVNRNWTSPYLVYTMKDHAWGHGTLGMDHWLSHPCCLFLLRFLQTGILAASHFGQVASQLSLARCGECPSMAWHPSR